MHLPRPTPALPPGTDSFLPALETGRKRLTMFESFLVQVRVRGGFPTQTQVRVTSEPMSVVVGLGSTTIRGATAWRRALARASFSSGLSAGRPALPSAARPPSQPVACPELHGAPAPTPDPSGVPARAALTVDVD